MTNSKIATAIALFLMVTIAITLVAVPLAIAHTPPWQIPTTAYMNVAPNPVGVGQTVFVVVWLDRTVAGAVVNNLLRFHNYKLTITRPDQTTETVTWPLVIDTTSSAYTLYTPTQVGTYTFKFEYPGETYVWNRVNTPGLSTANAAYENDTYMPSSRTLTLTVQEEQIPDPKTSYPLPTEYWSRPIEGQNTDWYSIASNWLGSGSPKYSGLLRKIQPDGAGPNSAHIMWSKPIGEGGVLGGSNTGIDGNTFYQGLTYNRRFTSQIIMYGRLYYEVPFGNSGGGGGWKCVDLRTGEEIWYNPDMGASGTGLSDPSFGYYLVFDDANQHGVLPQGLLFTSNFARAYDPSTGKNITTNITGVPSGTAILGPKGEHLRYVWDYNARWMAQWNSSKMNRLTDGQIGVANWFPGTYNASTAFNYDWNVTIPSLPGLSNPSMIAAKYQDMILGRSSSFIGSIAPTTFGTPDPYTFWALSLKPGQEGQLLWIKNYPAPANNVTLLQGTVDWESRIFTMYIKESMQWYGYSLDDGNQVWGPTPRPLSDFDYYEPETTGVSAYGNLYYSNYGGICYCYDGKTGELKWTYGNGGEGNSTDTGFGTSWGRWPIQPEVFADGKIYLTSTEHSPNTPMYKDARLICLDAETGEEFWSIMNYGGTYGGFGPQAVVADGYLVTLNQYDYQIYCYGKGPSAMTAAANPKVTVEGSSAIIEGTVIDKAAGTTQHVQAARFPNGVPAVSDESMKGWMEYVYMQKPLPTDVTGVEVRIEVLDANGNYREIGTTTSDASGYYSLMWTPDIPGKYTVVATFAGSESYYGSYAETSFGVDLAPEATPEPTQAPASTADQYMLPGIGIIVAAIAVVGAVLAFLTIRKK